MVTEDAAPALTVVGLREMSSANIPIRVKKRDGCVVSFDESRIRNAIRGAAYEVLQDAEQAEGIASRVTPLVGVHLAKRYRKGLAGVEDIQDVVEATLMRAARTTAAAHRRTAARC